MYCPSSPRQHRVRPTVSSLSQISDQKTVGWLTGRRQVAVVAEEVVAVKEAVPEAEVVQEVYRTFSRKCMHTP